MTSKFFEEAKEQSTVKTTIVEKYFDAWSKVIIPWAKKADDKIAYIDLFAGPGRYEDGTKSTPIKVLEKALASPDLRRMLVTLFNDLDSDNTQSLERAIAEIPGIERMKHPPQVENEEVGTQIVGMFQDMRLIPTLFFVDPWGYKGLSLGLIESVLKDWGCDCIFFFNYTRINMGIRNPLVVEHMDGLFGNERAERLRRKLDGLSAPEREASIIEAISSALDPDANRFVLPFRFKRPDGARTSHHLVFVTKHVKGYEIMKEIMARESSSAVQGVPSFEYNPAVLRQGLLFELSRPLDELGDLLLAEFAGRTLTMKDVYDAHHVGRPFIKANYKAVLRQLEEAGRIRTDPSARMRKKDTLADHVRITFARR
jgi:three-Cys-motif partner protein